MRSNRRVATLSVFLLAYGFAGALMGALCIPEAAAQFYPVRHRPTDVTFYRFQSPHFALIYQAGLLPEAREAAQILDKNLSEAVDLVGLHRPLRMPVVLNHFSDQANGYVSPLPFRQEIEAVHLRGKTLSPRFYSWLETVVPHELVHAAHAESGRGFGVGWLLRRLGPDLARSLNLSGPRGINEGAAVWMESRLRPGAGRLNYSLFDMEFRASMLSERPWSLVQMLEPPRYTRPFDRYYIGGAHVFEYLFESGAADFFKRARNFYYRFPLWGYGPALWYGTRMRPKTLERRLHAHFRERASAFRNRLGPTTEADVIASKRGASYRRPKWLDERTIIAYVSGYDIRPGFYRIDAATGRRDLISYQSITEDFHWSFSSDTSGILFSRYVPSPLTPAKMIAEVFRHDLATGETARLTTGGRMFGAVPSDRGSLWALRNLTQFNEWIEMDARILSGGVDRSDSAQRWTVGALDRGRIVTIEPSPSRDTVAIIVNREGHQVVYGGDVGSRQPEAIVPWLDVGEATVMDIAWSPDGRYLIASADPGGISNLFAYDVHEESLQQLTNVPFGAIEPAVSPDGRRLAYINYRNERYELVSIPFRPDSAVGTASRRAVQANEVQGAGKMPVPAAIRIRGDGVIPTTDEHQFDSGSRSDGSDDDGADAMVDDPAPYRPLMSLRPRVLYPFLLYQRPAGDEEDTNLGAGAGVGIEWADPMQYLSAHTSVYYQHESLWGRIALQSGHQVLRPSAEMFRQPSTVFVVRRDPGGGADTLRVGREEQGLGVGVRTPIVFASNVFQTHAYVSLTGEYRTERLFNDENRTISPAEDHVTLRPSIGFSYRVQANPRDIVPNSGTTTTIEARLDVWADDDGYSRWLHASAAHHVPALRRHNIGIQLKASLLTQNRGGIINLTTFFPRGYETEETFLDAGTYAKYGVEYTQPLLYIDDGIFLLPLYFKALFAYGFAETMHELDEEVSDRISVIGAGLGLQFRFAHSIDATLRVAPVYRFDTGDWSVTFR